MCILSLFFSLLILIVITPHFGKLFIFRRAGESHAYLGLVHLVLLGIGLADCCNAFTLSTTSLWAYDISLSSLGVVLSLTAARDFKHKNVKNAASGTLDAHTLVSYDEMIEHSFYHGINLAQIVFLHLFDFFNNNSNSTHVASSCGGLFFATSIWLFRKWVPVHSFSKNYDKIDPQSSAVVRMMYRVKKYQYVFYKHALLHGLNLSSALNMRPIVSHRANFRFYWVLLNVSYVFEFFLQTLVKKKYMSQNFMLFINFILMVSASLAAMTVLKNVIKILALASVMLNFSFRGHDLLLTMMLFFSAAALRAYNPIWYETIMI